MFRPLLNSVTGYLNTTDFRRKRTFAPEATEEVTKWFIQLIEADTLETSCCLRWFSFCDGFIFVGMLCFWEPTVQVMQPLSGMRFSKWISFQRIGFLGDPDFRWCAPLGGLQRLLPSGVSKRDWVGKCRTYLVSKNSCPG